MITPIDSGMGGTGSIEGQVYIISGQKLERRITVRLSTPTRGDLVTMTDDYGNFLFRGLVAGTYLVSIDKEKEFKPFVQQVDLIQLRGGGTPVYPLNIRLVPLSGTEYKADVVNSLSDVPKAAMDYYTKALNLSKDGNHKGAVEQLELAISTYSKFATALSELGRQYLQINELEKADVSLQKALVLEPETFAPLLNRGIVLLMLKRFNEAETSLRHSLKIDGRSASGHYFLGRAIANLGQFDEAEKELLLCIKLGGDEMKEAHRYLAIIYSAKEDKKREISELETYLRLAPHTPDAAQIRSLIQQLKGKDN